MLERFYDVDFYVYNVTTKDYSYKRNMVVLLGENYIYAVQAEHFFKACIEILKKNNFDSLSEREKEKYARNVSHELLIQCRITEKLQGEIYSNNTLWKITKPIHPIDFSEEFEGIFYFRDRNYEG